MASDILCNSLLTVSVRRDGTYHLLEVQHHHLEALVQAEDTFSSERSCPAPVFTQTSSVCVVCSRVETSPIDRPVGTGLLLCFTDNGASFNVQLDGQEPAADVPNDLACVVQGASKTISFQNLEFKAHSFMLSVTNASSAHEFHFFGAVMSTSIAILRYGLVDQSQIDFGSLMARFQ